MFINTTSEIEVFARSQLVKISFVDFRLVRLIFIGETTHLDVVYP